MIKAGRLISHRATLQGWWWGLGPPASSSRRTPPTCAALPIQTSVTRLPMTSAAHFWSPKSVLRCVSTLMCSQTILHVPQVASDQTNSVKDRGCVGGRSVVVVSHRTHSNRPKGGMNAIHEVCCKGLDTILRKSHLGLS